MRPKAKSLLRKQGEQLHNIRCGKNFMDVIPKAQVTKEEMGKKNLSKKLKKFF